MSALRSTAKTQYDAVLVGAGPNGLAATIVLAERGLSTLLVEAHRDVGGGMRSQALTVPGRVHDVFPAVHPRGISSTSTGGGVHGMGGYWSAQSALRKVST